MMSLPVWSHVPFGGMVMTSCLVSATEAGSIASYLNAFFFGECLRLDERDWTVIMLCGQGNTY